MFNIHIWDTDNPKPHINETNFFLRELDINKNNFKSENAKLLDKKNNLFQKIYSNLSAWDKVQVARHPNRPHAKDYINLIFSNII